MNTIPYGEFPPGRPGQRALDELPRPAVTFLVSGCRISLRQALVGALRELDKEGLVRFEPDQGGTPVVSLSAGQSRSGRSLLAYEVVALERLRRRTGTQGNVPLSALLTDDGDDYDSWAKRQVDEVAQETRRAGLARKRLPRHTWGAILPLIAAAICTAIVIHGIHPKDTGAASGVAAMAAVALLCVPIRLYRWRLTPEGDAAVDLWRRDGGITQGLMPGAVPAGEKTVWGLTAPTGAPLPPGHAWSSLGGQWHTVRLGLELKRPYWSGLPGLRTVLAWTIMASLPCVAIGFAGGFSPDGKLIALAPAALGTVVILAFWLPAFTMRMNLPDNVTFIGEVVRQWHVDGGDYSPDHDWVCIDDGSPTTMKFDVSRETYWQLRVGTRVRVSWSPRNRRLNHVEPLPS
jgi:hypothetical protein